MYIRSILTILKGVKLLFLKQTRQPIFVQLLHAAFKVSQCPWLNAGQRFNVENCIRTLSDVGKLV